MECEVKCVCVAQFDPMSDKRKKAASAENIVEGIKAERGGEDAWDEQRKSEIIWREE